MRLKVNGVERNASGRITGLCGPSFGYLSVIDFIARIESGGAEFYVREGPFDSTIRVVRRGDEKQLVTTSDVLSRNNLQNLRRC